LNSRLISNFYAVAPTQPFLRAELAPRGQLLQNNLCHHLRGVLQKHPVDNGHCRDTILRNR
jgi:hypothetical protein